MKIQQRLGWVRWNSKGATMSLFTQEIRISHTSWTHRLLQVSNPWWQPLRLAKGIPCLTLHCFSNALFIFAVTFGRGSGSAFNVMAPTWEEINYFSLISKSPTEHICARTYWKWEANAEGVLSHPPDCAVHRECVCSSMGDSGPNTHSLSRESSREDLGGIPLILRKHCGGAGWGEFRHCRPVHLPCSSPTLHGGPIWTVP